MGSLSKTVRALFLGVALVALMVACAGALFLNELRRPMGTSSAPVEIVVEPGDSTSAIATKLRSAELIRQPLLFTLLVRSQGLDGKLQAGTFYLPETMTMSEIVSALQQNEVAEEREVLIREGLRLEEIAEIVGQAGLNQVDSQAFLDAARNGDAFRDQFALLSPLPEGASLEGYLFPDTYRFFTTATVTDVIDTMLTRFDTQYKTFELEVQVQANVHEIVTMASVVQREGQLKDEMPRIAAVFWNRLNTSEGQAETGGGKIQADPTLQYVLGQPGEWWPKLDTLTPEELNNPDPYNTRVNPGLPPGPISNPGLEALRAAARPDATAQYLYFVASCAQDGSHNFATTLQEFQVFEQEYLACS
jgi:UPF0755 protein